MLAYKEINSNRSYAYTFEIELSSSEMNNLQTLTEVQRQLNMNIIPRVDNADGNLPLRGVGGPEIAPRVNGATRVAHEDMVDLVNINNNNVLSPREVGLILRVIGDDLNRRAFFRHNPTG